MKDDIFHFTLLRKEFYLIIKKYFFIYSKTNKNPENYFYIFSDCQN